MSSQPSLDLVLLEVEAGVSEVRVGVSVVYLGMVPLAGGLVQEHLSPFRGVWWLVFVGLFSPINHHQVFLGSFP